MEEKPNYYAIIPADVRYDNSLKDKAKLLYGEIVALSNKDGCCFASNRYFANLYDISTTTVSLLIKDLVDKGYLESTIEYKEGTKEILNRYLRIIKGGYLKNLKYPIKENLKDNNTSINNTSINNKENNKRKVFKKPTVEEIRNYCEERNNGIDAEEFYDFYESKGWLVGKTKMVDFKACVRTWEKRNNNKQKTYKTKIEQTEETWERLKKEAQEYDENRRNTNNR